ncbi:hypothetical protein, partial [Salinibius halmophilus]|uniref:hypothetical protein n=1 Tax=Salinibius halmophilus TaxID=1853216 RepID=UPI00131423D6
IMFHRRAQTATFYRGWFRKPVTVPYKQVTYTAGIDPRGTGGWLVIRARVPENIAFTGWVKLSTAISDQKAMAAGAIDVFMDLDNDFAMPERIKESIEWHQETKTTLWRYVKDCTSKNRLENYEKPDSLYKKVFCNTFDPVYKKAMNPDTIKVAREEFIKNYNLTKELEESRDHRLAFMAHKEVISQHLASLLDGTAPILSKIEFEKIEKQFFNDIDTGLSAQLNPFYKNMHTDLHKTIVKEESTDKKSELLSLSGRLFKIHSPERMDKLSSESIKSLFDIFKELSKALKNGLLSEIFLTKVIEKLKDCDDYSNGILEHYDWEKFEMRARLIVFSEQGH